MRGALSEFKYQEQNQNATMRIAFSDRRHRGFVRICDQEGSQKKTWVRIKISIAHITLRLHDTVDGASRWCACEQAPPTAQRDATGRTPPARRHCACDTPDTTPTVAPGTSRGRRISSGRSTHINSHSVRPQTPYVDPIRFTDQRLATRSPLHIGASSQPGAERDAHPGGQGEKNNSTQNRCTHVSRAARQHALEVGQRTRDSGGRRQTGVDHSQLGCCSRNCSRRWGGVVLLVILRAGTQRQVEEASL